jgi:hypothetical protein
MRIFPPSTADRIRAAFAFLTDGPGYRLIVDSDAGMAGSIAYRSLDLWITAEWDRGDPWLTFSAARSAAGPFGWELVDHLLRSAPHFDSAAVPTAEVPAEQLATWLRPRLAEIETRFRPPAFEQTRTRLLALQAEQWQERERYWANPRRANSTEGER